MTVWEFNHRVKGVSDRQVDEWRRARWLGALILKPHVKKGTRMRPQDLLPLPDDDKAIPKPTMTREERKADIDKAVGIWQRKLEKRKN